MSAPRWLARPTWRRAGVDHLFPSRGQSNGGRCMTRPHQPHFIFFFGGPKAEGIDRCGDVEIEPAPAHASFFFSPAQDVLWLAGSRHFGYADSEAEASGTRDDQASAGMTGHDLTFAILGRTSIREEDRDERAAPPSSPRSTRHGVCVIYPDRATLLGLHPWHRGIETVYTTYIACVVARVSRVVLWPLARGIVCMPGAPTLFKLCVSSPIAAVGMRKRFFRNQGPRGAEAAFRSASGAAETGEPDEPVTPYL